MVVCLKMMNAASVEALGPLTFESAEKFYSVEGVVTMAVLTMFVCLTVAVCLRMRNAADMGPPVPSPFGSAVEFYSVVGVAALTAVESGCPEVILTALRGWPELDG